MIDKVFWTQVKSYWSHKKDTKRLDKDRKIDMPPDDTIGDLLDDDHLNEDDEG